jgi:hypothetical protein
MVFARGLMVLEAAFIGPPTLLAMEFLRALLGAPGGTPLVLSRRPLRGRDEAAPAW